ncbi:uncharacterized protein ARMOST_08449 [Armillaria ostoyae]|uniref:Uncharacterized protein n=1 Tax=Armillaria ostoyae TaxID=47428 RepID=A0A284R8M1_ARMOS|nr:uncharacterized protein ARMOST_08449 [Armillaria ostoyae]
MSHAVFHDLSYTRTASFLPSNLKLWSQRRSPLGIRTHIFKLMRDATVLAPATYYVRSLEELSQSTTKPSSTVEEIQRLETVHCVGLKASVREFHDSSMRRMS